MDWKKLNRDMQEYKRTLTLEQWRENPELNRFIIKVQLLHDKAVEFEAQKEMLDLIVATIDYENYSYQAEYEESPHPCDMRLYTDNEIANLLPGLAYFVVNTVHENAKCCSCEDMKFIVDLIFNPHATILADSTVEDGKIAIEESDLPF